MKVEGSIFIDKEGIVFSKVKGDAQSTIRRFYNMLLEAKDCKDKLYYVYSDEWEEFWLKSQNPSDKYWQGAGQIVSQLLFSYNNFVFQPFPIGKSELFNEKSLPRIHGGLEYEGCPSSEYIYDKPSIDAWHDNWLFNHPERIDWGEFRHKIWPRCDRTIAILREELEKNKKKLEKEKIEIPVADEALVNVFHDYIMNHKSEIERISYAKDIGGKICKANYYHRETELEKLEEDYGNNHAEVIYSLKKDGKYIFLSVDKQHGMFELCDDKGDHVEEIRFDGSCNTGEDASHRLQCVAEWKRNYNK